MRIPRGRSRFGHVAAAVLMVGTVMARTSPAFAGVRPPASPGSGSPVVEVAQSPEGRVLVTGPGATVGADMALYEFSGDAFSAQPPAPAVLQFHCTATNTTTRFTTETGGTPCTTPWPPLMASAALVAGPGVRQPGLSRASAGSGFTTGQVEYFGHPLYTFFKDTPGTFNGEDIAAFGGIFWLVSPLNGAPNAGTAKLGTELTASGPALSTTVSSGARTLYMLSYDTPGSTRGPGGPHAGQSTCISACTAIWPPLLTTGRPIVGPGVNPTLVGELRRPDGTIQVTYAGRPVYMFFTDLAAGASPGETNGQYFLDNLAFGVWYEVAPQGGPQAGSATLTTNGGLLGVSSSAVPPLNPEATVYMLSSDTPTTSTCSGTCATFWPPVLTSLPPTGPGLTGTIGTIQRTDGTFQVTYNGHPLYFFSHDLTSGDAYGASITTPFGTFSVMTP
jgi:predicted lipoprotein with Yx(FWY)xxD motif